MSKRKPQPPPILPPVGSVISILLPRVSKSGRIVGVKRRRIRVCRFRDLAAEPLTVLEWLEAPMMIRGRFMLIGIDDDKGVAVSVPYDWQTPRRFRVYHSDGEPTKIRCGKSRYERACFGDICRQLADCDGVTIRPCDDVPQSGDLDGPPEEIGKPATVKPAPDFSAGALIGA